MSGYATPAGGIPPKGTQAQGRACFTSAYAIIPKGVMTDIVTSVLPGWSGARAWILARPLSGFAESFAWYIVELTAGGRSPDRPEPDAQGQAALFVLSGEAELAFAGGVHRLHHGSFAWLPPGMAWNIDNRSDAPVTFVWIRKRYDALDQAAVPAPVVTHEDKVQAQPMPGHGACWSTLRFLAPDEIGFDMHLNIVALEPGTGIPFAETHVMEHGIQILEGRGVYLLNNRWVEVEAGDFLWLRAFCPQAGYATGDQPFRYLLYKDVNRHPLLAPPTWSLSNP